MVAAPNTLDALSAALQSYVVAPLNAFGMGGFVFNVAGEAIGHLSADITDHYAEDNKALQDHIAIRPEKYTLKGYVGEVVYNTDVPSGAPISVLTQKLTTISAYLPLLSAGEQQLQDTIQAPSASSLTLSSAANIFSAVKNMFAASGNSGNQADALMYLKACQNQGILMGIQTPWEFITNMAIETITVVQDENSVFVSDFSVTFKKIRIAKTLTTAFSNNAPGSSAIPDVARVLEGAAGLQAEPVTNIGNVPGLNLPTALLPGDQSLLTGASSMKTLAGIRGLFTPVT